jgi:hypothetical protein
MAEKKQFFRDIQPGDVSIEGRQSNGITAKSDGSVILYSGVKDNELDSLQNYNGNVPIDGYLGNIIAVLKADQGVAFPVGNNNEETYIESPNVDPNKIIVATTPVPTVTPTPLPTGTITPTPTPTPTLPTKENKPPDPAIEYLPEDEFTQFTDQIFDNEITFISVGNLSPLSPEKYAEGEKVTIVGNRGYSISYTKKGKFFYPNTDKIPLLKDKSFTDKVKQIANEFGINAEFLIKIMINESGLNPAAGLWRKCLNAKCSGKVLYSNKPEAGYTLFGCGLVGFIRPYAPNVCNGNSVDTVITQSGLTQLDYVRNILKSQEKTVRGANEATLYMHFFIPALVKTIINGSDSTPLAYGKVTAETVSFQNPVIASTLGYPEGAPLTVGDFRKFVGIKFNYTIPPL